ncbi:unnamed protein product [Cladocopium goreaui]|uniref:Calcium-dependent protein kinase 28 n=1 Tax=Cladocopium goreaui TaxID=2562237 RepID=A0A9P1D3S9_9DINO|nr:unnamed protein product [Cladocopium goreaui]
MFFPKASLDLGSPQTAPGVGATSASAVPAQTAATNPTANGPSAPLGSTSLFPSASLNLAPAVAQPSGNGEASMPSSGGDVSSLFDDAARPPPFGVVPPLGAPPLGAPPQVAPPHVAPPGVSLPFGAPPTGPTPASAEPQGISATSASAAPAQMAATNPTANGPSAPLGSTSLFPSTSSNLAPAVAQPSGNGEASMPSSGGDVSSLFGDAARPPPVGVVPPKASPPGVSLPCGASPSGTAPASQGVIAFSSDGKMLRAGPNGTAKEYNVQDLLGQSLGTWLENLESFPGPFGRVDGSTTEALLNYLEKMASRFDDADVQYCTLESATKFPESAAIACRFLCCLVRANGNVQSGEFWHHFFPVLAKAIKSVGGDSSSIGKFCAKLCKGEVGGALEDACSESLWSHALAVSRLLAPQSSDMILLKFVDAAKSGKQKEAASNDEDLEDPAVQALFLMYECLAKGSVPEISEKVLSGWPAFAAMFSLLLRPGEYREVALSFIESLAARLASSGNIFAGHVCYLMTGERTLDAVDAPSSLVCILGVEHRSPKNFSRLLDPLALQLSEAYEYALRCGNADALCPTIQPFKLAHAMLLADMGLTEKAKRYMVLLQAFVKAVPQNRLSDAFRSSMREFNQVLNPQLVPTGAPAQEAPRVGKMVKDFVRVFAETTGFAVKPIAPPALPADDEPEGPLQAAQPLLQQNSGFQPARPMPQSLQQPAQPAQPVQPAQPQQLAQPFQPLQPAPSLTPCAAPMAPMAPPTPTGPNPFRQNNAESGGFPPGPCSTPFAPVSSSQNPMNFQSQPFGGGGLMGQGNFSPYPPAQSLTMPGLGTMGGSAPLYEKEMTDTSQDQPKRPDRMDFSETMDNDPFVNAGKAMLDFGKSALSALKQGGSDSRSDDRSSHQDFGRGYGSQFAQEQKPTGFYFNKEKGRWMEHGKEENEQEDISQYDPMTGKKITKVAELPPPPMGGMGGMGGPPVPRQQLWPTPQY